MAEPDPQAAAGAAAHPEPGALRTLAVAFAVCAVCAALLSGAVALLQPLQLANLERERADRVRALVEAVPGVSRLLAGAGGASLELRAVELASGRYAPEVRPERLLAGPADAEVVPLPRERDPARIGAVPRHAPVYVLRERGEVHTLILPVYGRGYLSMLRGYLAVAGDGDTIRGLAFVEHGETPGLGSEIERPEWLALWVGKRLRGDAEQPRIRVVQEGAADGGGDAAFRVQGISGATRTGEGVEALVRFWAGPDGFGPFLARVRAGEDG